MKQLMLGNKALARGLYEAGCSVVYSYPGTPSTEVTEEAAKYDEIYCEWAPNEKVAMEVAHGASLGGVRSATAMKHVGLNVAADPLFTISYQGLNAARWFKRSCRSIIYLFLYRCEWWYGYLCCR